MERIFKVELPQYRPEVIEAMEETKKIRTGVTLDEKNRDHELKGKYDGFRECHIQPAPNIGYVNG